MIVYSDPQKSEAWMEARRGVITGSRFKDAVDFTKKGEPSAKMLGYAYDLARERCGGRTLDGFTTQEMRYGTEQEPFARMAYEVQRGVIVEEAGFICTDDKLFGVSVDGLIGDDGIWECKTMASSATLFKAVVDGDISEYVDQCNGAMWLLRRKWVDLTLWAPDLEHIGRHLTVHRITRDDNVIDKLEDGLIRFSKLVKEFERKLMGGA